MLAEWLLTAIIKIVTNYTLPGQRVLLLDPAPYLVPPAPWPTAATGNRSRPSSYEGLHEAGWAVARLGRSIQTRTAATRRDPSGEHAADGPAKSESGPGPTTESPSADRRPGPDSTAAGDGPDRYDLIVTAADPRTLEWFCPADWGGLLAANGMLAVVTRGDRSGGRLVDPAGPLLLAAHHAGLRYLDRIALLHVPIRDGALAVANPATGTRSQAPAGGATSSVRHTQVHDDLLVFTNQPAPSGTADGEETSDA